MPTQSGPEHARRGRQAENDMFKEHAEDGAPAHGWRRGKLIKVIKHKSKQENP